MDNTLVDSASACALVELELLVKHEKHEEGTRGALTFSMENRHGSRV